MFIKTLFEDPRTFATILLLVVFSICLHEFCHAYVALKMGDSTAADRGHLTMNPFRQMGFISLIMLVFLGIAWGQVPVNPENLPSKWKRIAVALAGVAANFGLAVFFSFACFAVLNLVPKEIFAANMLLYGAVLNIVLLIVNLIPAPGFDGFKVIMEFVRIKSQHAAETANAVSFILMLIVFYCIDYIFAAGQWVAWGLLNLFFHLKEMLM